MKKLFKITLVFVIITLIIALFAIYDIYKKSSSYVFEYNERRTNILNSFDNRLNELDATKEIAKNYINIYTINDIGRYNDVKTTLYDNLSEDMKKKFDLLETNIPLSNNTISYTIDEIYSSTENEDGLQTFKVHFNLKEGEVNKEYFSLVTIKNNLITSAKSFVLE